MYGLCQQSTSTQVPNGLDRIIKYLGENAPQVKSAKKK